MNHINMIHNAGSHYRTVTLEHCKHCYSMGHGPAPDLAEHGFQDSQIKRSTSFKLIFSGYRVTPIDQQLTSGSCQCFCFQRRENTQKTFDLIQQTKN